jgi:hypothetical protein
MGRLSTSHALREFKIIEVVNEILDDNMRHCYSGHNGDFNDDYTQLVTPGTHVISSSDSGNYCNVQRTITYFDGQGLGIRGVCQ